MWSNLLPFLNPGKASCVSVYNEQGSMISHDGTHERMVLQEDTLCFCHLITALWSKILFISIEKTSFSLSFQSEFIIIPSSEHSFTVFPCMLILLSSILCLLIENVFLGFYGDLHIQILQRCLSSALVSLHDLPVLSTWTCDVMYWGIQNRWKEEARQILKNRGKSQQVQEDLHEEDKNHFKNMKTQFKPCH